MSETNVIDYDYGCDAMCPFSREACKMECMLMRPTVFGEPRCSFRVIADGLVSISGALEDIAKEGGQR